MKRPRLQQLSTLLGIVLVTLLQSCSDEPPITSYTKEKILVLGNSNEPAGLDPHTVSGVLEGKIIRALFEGLCVEHPSIQGNHEPGVAKSWEPKDDFKVWTFELQPNAKWSDGTDLTANDFIFSYHRILHPKFGAEYASMLYFIDGAEAYNKTQLGAILCGKDTNFPTAWETLKHVNFSGDSKVDITSFKNESFDNLDSTQKQQWIQHHGLDYLDVEILEKIQAGSLSFDWPEQIPAETRKLVIERLLSFKKNPYDLWDKAKVGVTALAPKKLEITLRGSVPFLPDLTKHYTWFPVPKHIILKHGKIYDKVTLWTDPENIVTNGPFKLKTWRFNDHIEVEKNPLYWDKKHVKLNGIRFLPISNTYTEGRMFFDNQLHGTYGVAPDLIEYARERYPKEFRQETYLGTSFIRFNMTQDKLKDIRVRRALSKALDRKLLVEKVIKGGETPARGMVPPSETYASPGEINFDIEEARKLLKEAGYSKENKLRLNLLTVDRDKNKRQAEAYQSMWEQNLEQCVEISIEQYEWKTYLTKLKDLEYDLGMGGWIGDYPDPTTFLDMWKKGDGNNRTGWSNENYEKLLAKAELTADPEQRIKVLQQAEAMLLEDQPFTPIYWLTSVYLIRPSVKNWNPLLLNNQPYKFVDLQSE